MREAGDGAVVMEVSSHALALHRADAIHWDAAVFTNLTQDHLDFHADMDDYFAAKRRLFVGEPRPIAVVNVDDPLRARAWPAELPGAMTIGLDRRRADCAPRRRRLRPAGCTFDGPTASPARRRCPAASTSLNALGAVAVARALGRRRRRDRRGAAAAPAACPGASSRSTRARASRSLVDYAHTPDSLENVLRAARELADRPRARGRSAPAATAIAASAR